MRRFFRDNGIALLFGALFLGSVATQAWAGWHVYNHEAQAHGSETIGLGRYLVSSHYGQAVLENWQSEWLQFLLFALATMFVVQKGSPESEEEPRMSTDKEERLGHYTRADSPRWAKTGGWRTTLYSYSLLIVMAVIFAGSWAGQSVTGWTQYNAEQRDHGQPVTSWPGYVRSAEFWEDTVQNWQSEFLVIGAVAIFSVFLRARHSVESKPVGAPHAETGSS